MLRGPRAAQVLIGMLVIFVAYVFSNLMQLETLQWIISKFYSSFIMVVIVLFQDDIRRLLSRFGKGPFFSGIEIRSGGLIIQEVVSAAKALSHERIGALIVFERSIGLDKLYDHSVQLNALVSEQLLMSIFQSFSPLHDGAVIVQKNRISCASAQLPLSKNPLFSKKLGTRHSAAVGISEETDAVVLVVSEETGHISIAWEGNLQKQSSSEAAKKMLHFLLLPRGDRNVFIAWWTEKFVFKINKALLILKTIFSFRSKYSGKNDRRRFNDRRSLLEAPRQKNQPHYSVQVQNSQTFNLSKNIFVRFKNDSNVTEIMSPSDNFVTSLNLAEKIQEIHKKTLENTEPVALSHQNSTPFEKEDDNEDSNQKESLRSSIGLLPEDRFDPPIPKPPPPRDVLVGGVSLNPPIDIDSIKNENEK